MLLDFAIHTPLESPEVTTKLYACNPEPINTENDNQSTPKHCPATNTTEAVLQLAWSGSYSNGSLPGTLDTLEQVGSKIDHVQVAESQAKEFINHLRKIGVPKRTVLQYCGTDECHTFGIVADTTGDLAAVQGVVSGWDNAQCTTDYESWDEWPSAQLNVSEITTAQETSGSVHFLRHLLPRATCKYIRVKAGDSCSSLARMCGISGDKFMEYNKAYKNLCSTLAARQIVCCSKGDLPDLRPKPGPDGSCAAYNVVGQDTCAKIAAEYSLSVSDLEDFNKGTWGWAGCNNLMLGTKMCLSKGSPPLPGEISNAVCGPQVPGTKSPGKDQKLADLNPCKLNACCNIWGQCDVTAEFCTKSDSSTGAPGTAAPGTNGCISNCGTDILNTKPRTGFNIVAYFEAWNENRPCMTMSVERIDTTKYTHIHFAFAGIIHDYHVNVSAVQDKFDIFVGVTDANRQVFADNVVNFIQEHNLDGVDFDWEYPGAPDIPGIPPGDKNDGANYVKFIKIVRKALPTGKTLSIAAPASYWYLLGFHPIEDFEPLLDYMIFMTYDLHGQWDYGNKWASSGCPNGDCLRSHVNYTETLTAMSMITKAGMPTNKLVMGVTRYGRSFKMTKPGCTGPMCTFVGPESAAAKGRCTGTAGYIADAEMSEIIQENPTAKKWFDDESRSDILVYNETESDWAVDLQSMYSVPNAGPFPTCDGKYETIDAILKEISRIPVYCVNPYAIAILSEEFKSSLEKYHGLMRDGYNKKFDTYANYTKNAIFYQIDDYMTSRANDNWTCKNQSYVHCCPDCGSGGCPDGCDNSCGKGESGNRNETVSCPNKVPEITLGNKADTIYWTLNDKDGFERLIADTYGIDPQWLEYGNRRVSPGVGCGTGEDLSCGKWWIGYPRRKHDITIPNPKDIIRSALTNLTDFEKMLSSAATDAMAMLYTGETSDVLTASELPVYMTEFAIKSMEKVVDAAKRVERDEQKQAILGFVMAFLLLVPALGEAAGSFGLTTVGRILMMTGAAGDAALGVYGVVEDPKSAVISLFTALIDLKGEAGFEKAAGIRRGMSSKESAALGSLFQEKSKSLQAVQRDCI
ncbi:uncharacterized protein LDX57_007166 [Aspergillus melleus]|uniref:uncharacterized protein n=1 Tax=Aspergillus melleus TaxID=138277 RepID=UPI001E8EC7A9|nr:uncharacterized protein LDX57_007166 [Aspergillus melleus]KAH8429504.1 hypothetical protein LDX57_007166 [Aspergillus melleus]